MNSLIVLVGPSGSGKTSIAEGLESKYALHQVHSYTTRKPRYSGERGHTFISDEQFDMLTGIVAYTEFDGHRYCATEQQLNECDIYVVDVAGAEVMADRYCRNKQHKTVLLFYIDVPEDIRMCRMAKRGDSFYAISSRVTNDNEMFADAVNKLKLISGNTFVIHNMNLQNAIEEIVNIVREKESNA